MFVAKELVGTELANNTSIPLRFHGRAIEVVAKCLDAI